jgi:WD40 repeat protein
VKEHISTTLKSGEKYYVRAFIRTKKYLIYGKLILYDLSQGNIVSEFNDHRKDITAVKFSHDGKLFATVGDDKMIRLYETGNLKPAVIPEGHKNWVRDLSFSYDCKVWIASPFEKYKIRIKGAANKILFIPNAGSDLIVVVATMNDGAMLIDAKNMKMKKF